MANLLFESKSTDETYTTCFYDDGVCVVEVWPKGHRESARNPRYTWRGEGDTLRVYMLDSDRMEVTSDTQQDAYAKWIRASVLEAIVGERADGENTAV